MASGKSAKMSRPDGKMTGLLGGYKLQGAVEVEAGRNDVYVLDLVHCKCAPERQLLAVAGTNNCVSIYDQPNLTLCNQLSAVDRHGSPGTVTGLCFSGNQLWCSSTNGLLRSWDLRSGQKPVSSLQGHNKEAFTCVSASCTSELLAGGTEKLGQDASIYFWDTRAGREPLAQFTQSHSDDVTKVVFSPTSSRLMISGSTDGLMCVFDLVTMEEEDAILSVKNSESSVATVGFFGPDYKSVYCLTHQETFHAWKIDQVEPLSSESRVRERMSEEYGLLVEFLIDCFYDEASQRVYLVTGDHSGGMHVIHADVEQGEFRPSEMLTGGHTATVRAVQRTQGGIVSSGGEDGKVCLWTPLPRT